MDTSLSLIQKMSLEEKAELCVGADYWSSKSFEKYEIPKIRMSDGPHGLRVQKTKADNLGINESEVSTCFPASSTFGTVGTGEKSNLDSSGETVGGGSD